MFSDFRVGFGFALSGLSAVRSRKLLRFVAPPVAISLVVFALVFVAGMLSFGQLIDAVVAWLPGWLDWLQWLLWPLFAMAMLLLAIYTFTMLANLIGAPFNGLLSARYELMLTSRPPPDDPRALHRMVLHAVGQELLKLGYLLRWMLPAALLFLLPGVNVVAPIVWLGLGAWLVTLEYVGYPMDNHALSVHRQRRSMASRWRGCPTDPGDWLPPRSTRLAAPTVHRKWDLLSSRS